MTPCVKQDLDTTTKNMCRLADTQLGAAICVDINILSRERYTPLPSSWLVLNAQKRDLMTIPLTGSRQTH